MFKDFMFKEGVMENHSLTVGLFSFGFFASCNTYLQKRSFKKVLNAVGGFILEAFTVGADGCRRCIRLPV